MKRKFLYEILDEIQEAEDFKVALFSSLDASKIFKQFVSIIYNKKYEWEVDKNIKDVKPRSERENGGFASAWMDVVNVIERKLIKNTELSKRFGDYYIKACQSCNKKDVDILNYALKNRNLPGFKGARKKIITDALKEYFGDEYETV